MYLICWLGLPLVAQCALAWKQYAALLSEFQYTEHVKQNLNFACESLY